MPQLNVSQETLDRLNEAMRRHQSLYEQFFSDIAPKAYTQGSQEHLPEGAENGQELTEETWPDSHPNPLSEDGGIGRSMEDAMEDAMKEFGGGKGLLEQYFGEKGPNSWERFKEENPGLFKDGSPGKNLDELTPKDLNELLGPEAEQDKQLYSGKEGLIEQFFGENEPRKDPNAEKDLEKDGDLEKSDPKDDWKNPDVEFEHLPYDGPLPPEDTIINVQNETSGETDLNSKYDVHMLSQLGITEGYNVASGITVPSADLSGHEIAAAAKIDIGHTA